MKLNYGKVHAKQKLPYNLDRKQYINLFISVCMTINKFTVYIPYIEVFHNPYFQTIYFNFKLALSIHLYPMKIKIQIEHASI